MRNGVTGAEGCQVFVMLSNKTFLFFLFEFSGTGLIGRKSWNANFCARSNDAQTVERRLKKSIAFQRVSFPLSLSFPFFPSFFSFFSFHLSYLDLSGLKIEQRCRSILLVFDRVGTTLKKSVASIATKKT